MIFDAIYGLQFFLAGIRRLGMVYSGGKYVEAYSKWDCFTVLSNILFLINTAAPGIMALFCCLDRFFSVTFPLKYYTLPANYAYFLIILGFGLSIPPVIASGIIVYQYKEQYTVNAICSLQQSMPEFMHYVLRGIKVGCSTTGVLLYIIIGYKIYALVNATENHTDTFSAIKRKRLITMTLTFLLITLNEVLLFAIPDIILMIIPQTESKYALSVINLNRGFVNILIFLITQKELRKQLIKKIGLYKRLENLFSQITPKAVMTF
uniref:G-protein coupled receptors family 1 profile domain-containing protein n=1 Tax=Panagrolaimus sp. JU765 TaxID=591449 RepID=A0AC34QG39_9BILA